MALLKCPECGESVSEFAKSCPNCGCPMSDIAQENQVADRSWDKRKEKSTTYTQAYSQEELNRALEEAKRGNKRQQRKPGQKRIVKNSESVLAGRTKKEKTGKTKKSRTQKHKNSGFHKKWIFMIIGILAVLAIVIVSFASMNGADKKKKELEEITVPQESQQPQETSGYYENPYAEGPSDSYEETARETKETKRETKETTQRQTTTKATAPPETQAPATEPEEPGEL